MSMEFYATLGPACASAEVLGRMLDAGMTGARLNLSHMGLEGASEYLEALSMAGRSRGLKPGLLIDTQGPELRTGALERPMELREGESLKLGPGGVPIPLSLLELLEPGMELLIDDARLSLEVTGRARARVLRGGLLGSRKGLSVEGLESDLEPLTDADRDDLKCASSYGVTAVMQSFTRSAGDIISVREALHGQDIRVFAKVESRRGVEALPELLDVSDMIVIARGDLGGAFGLYELPKLQKDISRQCRAAGTPFMVVTQLLYTMLDEPVPTRAEVSDIFNSVLDGASALMLTNETAAGKYPVEAMLALRSAAAAAENYII
mgnify:CR=1 FL=1